MRYAPVFYPDLPVLFPDVPVVMPAIPADPLTPAVETLSPPTMFLSPNGDGRMDSITVSATLQGAAAWTLDIEQAENTQWTARGSLFSASGSGSSVSVDWDATSDGQPVHDGTYRWILAASDDDGHEMTPVTGLVIVDRGAPTIVDLEATRGVVTPRRQTVKIRLGLNEGGVVKAAIRRKGQAYKKFSVRRLEAGAVTTLRWTMSKDATVTPGTYTVVIRAVDAAGNKTKSRALKIRIQH